MPDTWRAEYCPDAVRLQKASEAEDADNPDALYTAVDRPAWFAWETHRLTCTECKREKRE